MDHAGGTADRRLRDRRRVPGLGYHGYWAEDFHRLDPRFGSEEELRLLVEAAHARGIAVLLDVVYNHPGYESRYLTDSRTRAWLRDAGRGTCGDDDLTSCLAGLPDFKTDLPEVREYLFEAHSASPNGPASTASGSTR